MKKKIQDIIRLASLIFTICTVLLIFTGTSLTNGSIIILLFISCLAAAVKFLFFKSMMFNYSWYTQLLYIVTIAVIAIITNLITGVTKNIADYFLLIALVLCVYFIIRIIIYRHDKQTVRDLNTSLSLFKKQK